MCLVLRGQGIAFSCVLIGKRFPGRQRMFLFVLKETHVTVPLLYATEAYGSFSLSLKGILTDAEIDFDNTMDPPLVALSKEFNSGVLGALGLFPCLPLYLLSNELLQTYYVLCPQAQPRAQTQTLCT